MYCASSTQVASAYREAATELGHLLGERNLRVINGAGNSGLMCAVSDAALAAGGGLCGGGVEGRVAQGEFEILAGIDGAGEDVVGVLLQAHFECAGEIGVIRKNLLGVCQGHRVDLGANKRPVVDRVAEHRVDGVGAAADVQSAHILAARDPAAMTIFSAVISSSPTRRVFGPMKRPVSRNKVTLGLSARQSRPASEIGSMRPKMRSRTWAQSALAASRCTPTRAASAGLVR